jgi:mono/diheme cytochrome c family protein
MNRILRRTAIGVGALAGIVLLGAGAVYGVSEHRMHRTYAVSPRPLPAVDPAVAVERGRHIATAIGKCGDCHGDDLGGHVMADDPAFGRLVAPNLPRGANGAAARFSDEDFVRAIHHGVKKDGTSLVVMPATAYSNLSAPDLASLVAYLRSLPPVERALPPMKVGPLARALFVAGKLDDLSPAAHIDHGAAWVPDVPRTDTVAYGRYLAVNGGCTSCHGANLAGGPMPGPPGPIAANLTPAGVAGGREADFVRTLRTGVRPNGAPVNEAMPVKYTKLMTDDEIHAVWRYLQSVPAVATVATR